MTWDCEAYGPAAAEAGALCFFSPQQRDCQTQARCQVRLHDERRRVFELIRQGAAAGKPEFVQLAKEFTSAQQLLNGSSS